MSDASLSITNSLTMRTRTFEANSAPLETTTLGINFSSSNDFNVKLQIPNGPAVYLMPEQVDAIRLAASGARDIEDANIQVSVGGRSYPVPQATIQQLQGNLMR